MLAKELLTAFGEARKRTHVIGNGDTGVIIALDMEGRMFTVLNGKVLNRINMEAVLGQSTSTSYLNPGGDGLWPAPEGTTAGFQYSTGQWRPSPSLRSARFLVTGLKPDKAVVEAEVDLINNRGAGIPTIFKRTVQIVSANNSISVKSTESIRYIGSRILNRKDVLLAPWSLCQFDSGDGCEVIFPCHVKSSVWDLYEGSSVNQRTWNGKLCRTKTDGGMRYQVAMDKTVSWIEYHDSRSGLIVKRTAKPIPQDQNYVDIRDASPETLPGKKGVRYSVYSDPSNFMEIEAAGGCPAIIRPGSEMTVSINTKYYHK